jgi:hypothetical protein
MKKEITIDGTKYIAQEDMDLNPYCIIRGDRSGVFAANIIWEKGSKYCELRNCRRIWYWDGAASISQLAKDGVSAPENCKFSCEVLEHHIADTIEVIPCTEKAIKSIKGVKIWER